MRGAAISLLLVHAHIAVGADECTFWVGFAQQQNHWHRENSTDIYDDVQSTSVRARVRETKSFAVANGVKIELADAGSIIKGNEQASLSARGGGNVSSGHGQAPVSGAMIGAFVLVDKSGTPLDYAMDLGSGESYPIQTTWTSSHTTTNNTIRFQGIYVGRDPDPQKPRHFTGAVMQGNYEVRNSEGTTVSASWDLKPVKAPCDQPPAIPDIPPASPPKCPPPTTQRALMDTTWNQRQAKAHQLEEDFKELQGAYQKMQDNQSAWRSAIPLCAIEEIGEKTAEAILSGYGGERAEFTEALGKIATGDLSYIGQGEWSNLGDALTNITSILSAAVGAGDPKAMEEQIADCKALPENLKDGAKAFVDAYAEVKSAMPKIQKEVNDVHSLDQTYWDQWHKYHQACVDYAQCMGTPPTQCPAPPAGPSGRMPGQQ